MHQLNGRLEALAVRRLPGEGVGLRTRGHGCRSGVGEGLLERADGAWGAASASVLIQLGDDVGVRAICGKGDLEPDPLAVRRIVNIGRATAACGDTPARDARAVGQDELLAQRPAAVCVFAQRPVIVSALVAKHQGAIVQARLRRHLERHADGDVVLVVVAVGHRHQAIGSHCDHATDGRAEGAGHHRPGIQVRKRVGEQLGAAGRSADASIERLDGAERGEVVRCGADGAGCAID